ncbi:hypothetical protein STEG23_019893, partial [Scotinomys teguina]
MSTYPCASAVYRASVTLRPVVPCPLRLALTAHHWGTAQRRARTDLCWCSKLRHHQSCKTDFFLSLFSEARYQNLSLEVSWPGIHYADQAGFKVMANSPVSAYR